MDRRDVFSNQLLDALLQISMARGVSHAARIACGTPALNSPPERVPKNNAHRTRSSSCLDVPHPTRTDFDPATALLDRALGRKRATEGEVS
jgi:hypothetical protein